MLNILTTDLSSRGLRMVRRWADAQDLEIIFVRKGLVPFSHFYGIGGASPLQSLFHVVVKNRAGEILTGWARCRHWLAGLLVNKVEFFADGLKRAEKE